MKKIFSILIVDIVLILLFLISFSYVLQNIKINSSFYLFIGIILFLLLGFINSLIMQKQGFLTGIITGLIILIMLFAIIILVLNETPSFVKLLIYTLSSGLGGILGKTFYKNK